MLILIQWNDDTKHLLAELGLLNTHLGGGGGGGGGGGEG